MSTVVSVVCMCLSTGEVRRRDVHKQILRLVLRHWTFGDGPLQVVE